MSDAVETLWLAVLNGLLPALLLTACVWLAARLVPGLNAATRHSLWWLTLAAVLLLLLPMPREDGGREHAASMSDLDLGPVASSVDAPPAAPAPGGDRSRRMLLAPGRWAMLGAAVWAVVALWRLLVLFGGWRALRRLKRSCVPVAEPLAR
ncbi:MAG: hypothetical protein FJW40_03510 [Acidobacteria bacterium]|nr:hypothetical protein [Acidobacteriota bacterium]